MLDSSPDAGWISSVPVDSARLARRAVSLVSRRRDSAAHGHRCRDARPRPHRPTARSPYLLQIGATFFTRVGLGTTIPHLGGKKYSIGSVSATNFCLIRVRPEEASNSGW